MDFRTEFFELLKKESNTDAVLCKTVSQLKDKQLKSLQKYYAKGVKVEEIVAVEDLTLFGFGKDGVVITETGFYTSDLSSSFNRNCSLKNPIAFSTLEKVEARTGKSLFTFTDGSQEEVYVGAFATFISVGLETYKKIHGTQSKKTKSVAAEVKQEPKEEKVVEEPEKAVAQIKEETKKEVKVEEPKKLEPKKEVKPVEPVKTEPKKVEVQPAKTPIVETPKVEEAKKEVKTEPVKTEPKKVEVQSVKMPVVETKKETKIVETPKVEEAKKEVKPAEPVKTEPKKVEVQPVKMPVVETKRETKPVESPKIVEPKKEVKVEPIYAPKKENAQKAVTDEFYLDINDPNDDYDMYTNALGKGSTFIDMCEARLKKSGYSLDEFYKVRNIFIEEKRKYKQFELHNQINSVLHNESFEDLKRVNVLVYGIPGSGKKTFVSALSKAALNVGTGTEKTVEQLQKQCEYNKSTTGYSMYTIEGNVKGMFNFTLTAFEDGYEMNRYLLAHKGHFDVGMLVYNPLAYNEGANDALHFIAENSGDIKYTMVVMTMEDKLQEEHHYIQMAQRDAAFAKMIGFDGKDHIADMYEDLKTYAERYTAFKPEDFLYNDDWTKTSPYYIKPVKMDALSVINGSNTLMKRRCANLLEGLGKYALNEGERPIHFNVEKVLKDPNSSRTMVLGELTSGEIPYDINKICGYGENGGHEAKVYGVCGKGGYLGPSAGVYRSNEYMGFILEDEQKHQFQPGDILTNESRSFTKEFRSWIYIEHDPFGTGMKFERTVDGGFEIRICGKNYLVIAGTYGMRAYHLEDVVVKEGLNEDVMLEFHDAMYPLRPGDGFEVVSADTVIGYGYVRKGR